MQLKMFLAYACPSSGAYKLEAATVVYRLLMMGMRMPETC